MPPDQAPTPDDVVRSFIDLASDVEIAMLTTVSADGSLHSRPMGTLKPISLRELWFFTRQDSAKIVEIERERQVALTYSNPVRHRYVAVSGTASVERDTAKAQELWTPLAKLWFPAGPGDEPLRLLRVEPHVIEYWDAEEKRMKLLFAAARARMGERVPNQEPSRARIVL
jgi:general stress protein 26